MPSSCCPESSTLEPRPTRFPCFFLTSCTTTWKAGVSCLRLRWSCSLLARRPSFWSLPFELNEKGQQWHWMIGVIVFTTLQVQDLCDQEGDRDRGRRTIPVIFGDNVARWTVAIPIAFWSYVAPSFWRPPPDPSSNPPNHILTSVKTVHSSFVAR